MIEQKSLDVEKTILIGVINSRQNAEKSKDGRNRQQHTSTNVISTTMEQPTSQQI